MTSNDLEALNRAMHRSLSRNQIIVRPGMARDDLNDQLRRAGRGDTFTMPTPPADPEPERAAGGSGDGGAGLGTPIEDGDPIAALNRALRRELRGW